MRQRALDEARRAGRIIAVKLARRWMYRHEDLVEFAAGLPTSM